MFIMQVALRINKITKGGTKVMLDSRRTGRLLKAKLDVPPRHECLQ